MASKRKRNQGGVVPQEFEPAVPIDALQPHPRNVNEGDLGAVIESVTANRFYGAVLVHKASGFIIAGKHRWLAAKESGLLTIPVIWLDVDDATALRIMLADNRTARLGHDDPLALSELLQSIVSDSGSLSGTGFTGDDLDELLADMGNQELEAAEPEAGKPKGGPVICPACGHEFSPK